MPRQSIPYFGIIFAVETNQAAGSVTAKPPCVLNWELLQDDLDSVPIGAIGGPSSLFLAENVRLGWRQHEFCFVQRGH